MTTLRHSVARHALALTLWSTAAALALAACGDEDEGVGSACEVDDDCPTGTCYVGPGGGYCTAECSGEGSTDGCPEDTVCKPIQGGPERCLLICGSETACDLGDDCGDDACPSGSSCVDISGTSSRGCEPDPN